MLKIYIVHVDLSISFLTVFVNFRKHYSNRQSLKISGNIRKPFISEIVNKYHRHFFKLVQCHDKVYPDRRQFENICCKEGKWDCNKPHKYGIYDHSKSGITATPEAAAYKTGINAFTHKTPGCHNDKNAKIINSRLC